VTAAIVAGDYAVYTANAAAHTAHKRGFNGSLADLAHVVRATVRCPRFGEVRP
jgi:hypothetical protein